MNKNKNCAQEIRQLKGPQLALPPSGTSPNWHLPQLALPPTGPRPRLKSPNCRYNEHNWSTQGPLLLCPRNPSVTHVKCVSSTQKSVSSRQKLFSIF